MRALSMQSLRAAPRCCRWSQSLTLSYAEDAAARVQPPANAGFLNSEIECNGRLKIKARRDQRSRRAGPLAMWMNSDRRDQPISGASKPAVIWVVLQTA